MHSAIGLPAGDRRLGTWHDGDMAAVDRRQLLARGRLLELVTLGWNLVGIIVLAIAAVSARSVALAGFGLDSLIEIGASTVVLWELADIAEKRQLRAMRLIGGAFVALALYLAVQSTVVLVAATWPISLNTCCIGPLRPMMPCS